MEEYLHHGEILLHTFICNRLYIGSVMQQNHRISAQRPRSRYSFLKSCKSRFSTITSTTRTGSFSAISSLGLSIKTACRCYCKILYVTLQKVDYLYITKIQNFCDMTKPRLVKVRALFYGFQYITKQRGCANPMTRSGGYSAIHLLMLALKTSLQ